MKKKLIPCMYLFGGDAVPGFGDTVGSKAADVGESKIVDPGDVLALAKWYSDNGADEILVSDLAPRSDAEQEAFVAKVKEICEICECPVLAAGNIERMEDVKKLIYAGCAKAVLNFSNPGNVALLEEVSGKFGKEKMICCITDLEEFSGNRELIETYADAVLTLDDLQAEISGLSRIPVIVCPPYVEQQAIMDVLMPDTVYGITGPSVSSTSLDLVQIKKECSFAGLEMNIVESKISWSQFKLNSDGMIPVIVQDYKTDEVLMLAYMNEEAFETTLRTGKMTYWSRSRNELWVKGLTSGHFQYVKSLSLDCDNDTILAKVAQVGAACHTGSRSCFFKELMKKEYDDTNPLHVFQDVYNVILDRKTNPKKGSYTNYLYEKGIDKILKKVGEECTEIVIAAKNPDPEEIKYEISDFLYHVMVLMAVKDVTWEDITRELARR